ncbi:MAG: hypothetical protein AAF492_22945, partial [Verrucomicrobiota bacterium]
MPQDVPQVGMLRFYHEHYAGQNDYLVAVETEDAEKTDAIVAELEPYLETHTDMIRSVSGGTPWEDDPAQLSELLAYAWINSEEAEVENLVQSLRGPDGERRLNQSLETLAESIDMTEVGRASFDPFQLTDLGGGDSFSMGQASRMSFGSPGGELRILFVQPKTPHEDPDSIRRWARKLERVVNDWQVSNQTLVGDGKLIISGRSIYLSEMNQSLKISLFQSLIFTVVLVVGLFWTVYRNIKPL